MASVLLDTHALIWFLAGEPMSAAALVHIAKAQSSKALFVSSVSAWEAGLAALKPKKSPNLLGLPVETWFRLGVRKIGARTVPLSFQIAIEAAKVPQMLGYGDPGDCFLIATARVKKLTLVTRDRRLMDLARSDPRYLQTVAC